MALKRTFWFTLAAGIVWAALMGWEASEYRRPDCPTNAGFACVACKLDSPITRLELAAGPADFRKEIDQGGDEADEIWNVEIARANTCMDFLFIALYWMVFVCFARLLDSWTFRVVFPLISLTAFFDVGENVRLLQALHAIAGHQTAFPVSHPFSVLKWGLFAAAQFMLGVGLLQARKKWPLVIAILILSSAVLTGFGITHLVLLTLAVLLLFVALLIALFFYFPFGLGWARFLAGVEFAYLIRFQLIAALLLSVGLPTAYFLSPSIFIGLFDVIGFWSLVAVVAAAINFAWTVMVTIRLVSVYGPARFPGIATFRGSPDPPWSIALLFGGLAAPCIALACCVSHIRWWHALAGIALGIAIATSLFAAAASLHMRIEPSGGETARTIFPAFPFLTSRADQSRSLVGRLIDRTVQFVLPGETHPGFVAPDGRLHSGHQMAATALLATTILYAGVGIYFRPTLRGIGPGAELGTNLLHHPQTVLAGAQLLPSAPSFDSAPAALFFLFLLLTILTQLFSGLAFLFDKIRLPVLTTALIFSLLFGAWRTDHQFDVFQSRFAGRTLSPTEAIQAWEDSRGQGDPVKPIILVATAGGGIRAASWTAEVLTGLTDRCTVNARENKFASSLLLVSSVSGGSLGAMYVVGSYDWQGRLSKSLSPVIRRDAAQSSLSAVGWGMVYPDFLRTVPFIGSLLAGRVFHQDVDRGWALETDWLVHWNGHLWNEPPRIRDWAADTGKGTRPAVIFNATAAESGQRFLVGSTSLKRDPQAMIQFATDFPNFDIGVATAARLSASFPWVSPMPRASQGDKRLFLHIADGGYYDNSGILTATQWLIEAAPAIKEHPVFFLVIGAVPGEPAPGKTWSWQRQAIGPGETLLSVRDSSQVARAEYELDLVIKDLRSQGIDIKQYDFLYGGDPLAPLSWHLTNEQEGRIENRWSAPDPPLQGAIGSVTDNLGCR